MSFLDELKRRTNDVKQIKRVGETYNLPCSRLRKEIKILRANLTNLLCGELVDRRFEQCVFCDNRKGSICTKGRFTITRMAHIKKQKCPEERWPDKNA